MPYKRSAIISIARINKIKREKLKQIYNKGLYLTKKYIDVVWNTNIGKFASSEVYNEIQDDICTAKFRQLCCKNAIAVVKAIHNKQEKRTFIYDRLVSENDLDNANKLKLIIDKVWLKKPEITNYSLDLSGNCVEIKESSRKTKHQCWIRIKQTFLGESLSIPFFKTKIYNKYANLGELSQFLQITQNGLAKVIFKMKCPKRRKVGETIGCDIGINSLYALSKNDISAPTLDSSKNKNLVDIYQAICKTKSNSVRCNKKRTEARNYTNWAINQIDWTDTKTLIMEDLKNVKFKRKVGRFLSCWRYPLIIQKFESKCQELGISVVKVPPDYTSMRCSHCGWVKRENRRKTVFLCTKCSFRHDADINAARNISSLVENEKIKGNPDVGFYYKWRVNGLPLRSFIDKLKQRYILALANLATRVE